MFNEKLNQLKQEGLYRSLTTQIPEEGPAITIDGKSFLSFCSNNYLGLSSHPLIIQEGQIALGKFGAGSGASRLLSGTFPPHQELEIEIAKFKKTEAALVFGSGYLANLALLTTLVNRGDLILADRLNHASLVDGCKLGRATFKIFKHKDMDHLKHLLSKKPSGQKTLIVTEGVFSMDGDLAPLPEIVTLAREYHAQIMVDDAHGFGILGHDGRGSAEYFGVEDEIDIQMGTLGKAVGIYGAFVSGTKSLINYLINKAKSFIYTTALPPAIPAMCIASLRIMSQNPSFREKLRKNQTYFTARLIQSGFSVQNNSTPIIPLLIGDIFKTLDFSKALFDAGIYIPAIRPPTVPEGMGRLRISLSASHTQEHLDCCIEQLKRCGKSLGIL
ncbi:MAG: 8-amino-7-oxononanoate synthase [Nitrospiria bacterium]